MYQIIEYDALDSYQFALPKPLEFTHGTSIPFYLSITSQDPALTSIFSAPQNWQFYLSKHTSLMSFNPTASNMVVSPSGGRVGDPGRFSTFTDTVSKARLWRTEGVDMRGGFAIRGEVDIPRGATPSFSFPSISVRVSPENANFMSKEGLFLLCST